MTNLRMKILQALLGDLDYTVALHDNKGDGHEGAVLFNGDEAGIARMGDIFSSAMERKEEVKAVILGAAASYLSRSRLMQGILRRQFTKIIKEKRKLWLQNYQDF